VSVHQVRFLRVSEETESLCPTSKSSSWRGRPSFSVAVAIEPSLPSGLTTRQVGD